MAAPASQHVAEVVLVRHGETDWNVSRIVQGQIDEELNDTGRQQAAKVAHRLSQETHPAAVYSSDLKRAAETARKIAEACRLSDSDLEIEKALTERHMGLFQGMTIEKAMESEHYKAYALGGRDQELPGGGESLDQLFNRCVPYVNTIADKYEGQRVVVVTHEAVIQEICGHADPTISVRSKVPNASISVVHVSGSDGSWILKTFGDDGHVKKQQQAGPPGEEAQDTKGEISPLLGHREKRPKM